MGGAAPSITLLSKVAADPPLMVDPCSVKDVIDDCGDELSTAVLTTIPFGMLAVVFTAMDVGKVVVGMAGGAGFVGALLGGRFVGLVDDAISGLGNRLLLS